MPESIPAIDISTSNLRAVMEELARSSHREGAEEARQDALRVPFTKALVAEARTQGYREGAEAMRNLFVPGEFTAHSGGTLPFKIDCDALSDADIATLAAEIARRFKFAAVYGVPRGGIRLADALAAHRDPRADRTLIVDDVLTTGRSMEEAKARFGADPLGAVIFARGPCPPWVTPLFDMHRTVQCGTYREGAEAMREAEAQFLYDMLNLRGLDSLGIELRRHMRALPIPGSKTDG